MAGLAKDILGFTWKSNPGGHIGTKRKTECEAKSSSESLARAQKVYTHRKGYRSIPSSLQRFLLQCSTSGSQGNYSGITATGSSQPLCQTTQSWSSQRQGLVFAFQIPLSGLSSYYFHLSENEKIPLDTELALILNTPATSNETETPFFPCVTQIHSMRNIKQQISNKILSSVVLISSCPSNKTFKYYLYC